MKIIATGEEAAMRFTNHYHHQECGTSWDDDWHCMPDDDCPGCGCRHIEPYDATDHLGEAVKDFLDETPDRRPAMRRLWRLSADKATDILINWLVDSEGWDAEELGPNYQRQDVKDELAKQLGMED